MTLTPTKPVFGSNASAVSSRSRWTPTFSSSLAVGVLSVVILSAGVLRTSDLASNLTLWLTSALLALSLQFIWGNVGILSFAQGVFYGIGAYTYGVLSINFGVQGSTLLYTIPAGLVAAAVAAALGYFVFYGRLSDIAVAIITYAFTLVIAALASSFVLKIGEASIGGANGLIGIRPLSFGFGDQIVVADVFVGFIVTLVCTASIWLVLVHLRGARFGRILNGIRQNDDRSTLIGYDVRAFKLSSFALGGGVAGIAGALFAAWSQFVNPGQFSASTATFVVIWVLVGGRRSPVGCVVGAILISAVQFYFGSSDYSQYVTLILGALAVAVILIAPDGVAELAAKAGGALLRAARPRASSVQATPAESALAEVGPAEVVSRPGANSSAVGQERRVANPLADGLLLEVRDVSKSFGGVKAVSGVDLHLRQNEIRCIIGPNGAGKSTLFGLLSGRLRLDRGSIVFNGRDISRLPSFKRARLGIGIKMQAASFFPEQTVRENVDLSARAAHRTARPALVARCLAETGLAGFEDQIAFSLSHGQQQWLEIAMVLAQEPSLILLDEPVAGMTVGERRETVEMIHRLAQTCGVIVVEHDMSVVEELGGDVVVMHEGRVLRTGDIHELRKDEQVLDAYLGRDGHDSTEGVE